MRTGHSAGGLILLPAGERVVRFYPRYDTEPSALDEALSILRLAIDDLVGGRGVSDAATAPKILIGLLNFPLDTIEVVDLTPANFETYQLQIQAVEQERYGTGTPDAGGTGRRPMLQFPLETLETTMAAPGAFGVSPRPHSDGSGPRSAARSRTTTRRGRVRSAPGERNTFYLQAMATLPSAQNANELENHILDRLRERAIAAGFEFLSTLIEDRLRETAPQWFQQATVLESLDNYLRSGVRFAYLQVPLQPADPANVARPAGS